MTVASRLIPLAVAAVLVVATGVAHGVLTNRWGQSERLTTAVGALDRVPADFGDWHGENVSYDPHDLERAGIRGSVWRTYKNDRTGATLAVLLVCGRGGPISVHTPDVCYAGAGYRQVAPQAHLPVNGERSGFWSAPFDKPDPLVPQRLTVVWAWSQDGREWVAPDNPRSVCAWQPSLYKLYVVHSTPPTTTLTGDPVPAAFLADFLPRLQEALATLP